MSDRRPENPTLWMWGCGMTAPEFSANHTHEMECLVSADLLAVVRRGVESGTIKGEVFWMIPDEYEHLRGSLWTGPPTDGKGYAVLVIPVEGGEDR